MLILSRCKPCKFDQECWGTWTCRNTTDDSGLRERAVLRVDGAFKSGVDVVMVAIMGADEHGFGSVAMIATGCIMARICHTNNCLVDVASQREELRARFSGVLSDVVNLFLFVAEEIWGLLAQMGYEKLEVIGRKDLLDQEIFPCQKTHELDLSYTLSGSGMPRLSSSQIRNQNVPSNGVVLDDILPADPEILGPIEQEKVVNKLNICNIDRAACSRIAGVIAKKYGDASFAGQLNITKGDNQQNFQKGSDFYD